MNKKNRALWEVNIATIVLSTNSIFVELISLPAELILVFRAILASAALFLFMGFLGESMKLKTKRAYLHMLVLGIFMLVNWLFFFYSVKVSTIAISMLVVFTYPIMTVFLEPYFIGGKLDSTDLLMALAMFIGIIFLIPEFDLSNNLTLGVIFGLISALGYSLRNVFIRKWNDGYSSLTLMNYQLLVMVVFMLPFLFIMSEEIKFVDNDLWYLIILAVIGTSIVHTMFVKSLAALKASTASVIGGAQPVYSILIAFFFLSQVPDPNTLIGGTIIIAVSTLENVRHARKC